MSGLPAGDAALLAAELPPLRQVETATGSVVEYRGTGPADAPAIVLLHGVGSSSAGYRAQFVGLADSFRLLAWNAPGYGGSTPLPEADPTALDYAAALAAWLDALGVTQPALLAGSSWGSVIALNLAVMAPERVGPLVLSAPNTGRGSLPVQARAEALAALRHTAPAPTDDRAAVAARLLAPHTAPRVRALVERLRDALTPGGWSAAMHMMFTTDTPSLIGRARGPVALLAGTLDQVAPLEAHAAKLQAARPDAVMHMFECCGHMLKLEAPGRFNDILRAMATGG